MRVVHGGIEQRPPDVDAGNYNDAASEYSNYNRLMNIGIPTILAANRIHGEGTNLGKVSPPTG